MAHDRTRGFAAELVSRGDVLMFGGKKGEAAELFNRLANALAVLAFAPGGIKVFGAALGSSPATPQAHRYPQGQGSPANARQQPLALPSCRSPRLNTLRAYGKSVIVICMQKTVLALIITESAKHLAFAVQYL
jgi:hypothetical protein